jgi:hypothetical protein
LIEHLNGQLEDDLPSGLARAVSLANKLDR